MADPVVAVVSGAASAIIAGVLTYVTAVLKIRRDLAAQYDADLRRDRIGVYKELWKSLQPLARYAPERSLTCADAHALAGQLRSWYFEQGGLYLSEASREAYFGLQDALKDIHPSDKPLSKEEVAMLRERGSTLRTHLTKDVGTRAQPILNE
jgi:hypothetical protein